MVRAQSTASVLTPICGTWTGNLPAAVGGGQWTWDIPQQGDCSRRPFAGTVSVASTNTLKLGRDSFTGTTFINPDGARVYRGIRRSQCVPVDAESPLPARRGHADPSERESAGHDVQRNRGSDLHPAAPIRSRSETGSRSIWSRFHGNHSVVRQGHVPNRKNIVEDNSKEIIEPEDCFGFELSIEFTRGGVCGWPWLRVRATTISAHFQSASQFRSAPSPPRLHPRSPEPLSVANKRKCSDLVDARLSVQKRHARRAHF